MSLVDFSVRGVPILDLTRQEIFLSFRKGLGPLILPHFNQDRRIPPTDRGRFPHARLLEERGIKDPFQHGVGRYVPWRFQAEGETVVGRIGGVDLYQEVPLRELEGFDFQAEVRYTLGEDGLEIAFDVSSRESPVACGIHFYYDLVDRGSAAVVLPLAGTAEERVLRLDRGLDQAFPFPKDRGERLSCLLRTAAYTLTTTVRVQGPPAETFDAVIVFSPEGESFACVEPLSYLPSAGNSKRAFRGKILLRPEPA
jgi:galactose mutarotase-like enzyme